MILIVNMNSKNLGFNEFILPLCALVEPLQYDVVHYTQVPRITAYQKIVLSGVPLKDNEYLHDIHLFDWIKSCDTPILGICAGMQVIGLVFNSLLNQCQEIGMTKIQTAKENFLFSSTFTAYELHTCSIIPSDELEILATSKKCIQAIKHRKKEIYGVLFHPEVRNRDIIKRFICIE